VRAPAAPAVRQAVPRPAAKKDTAYHAVSIHYESNACAAARRADRRRFLAAAAPGLPLPECDIRDCRCRFVHHADRRSGRDRRSPFAGAGAVDESAAYGYEKRSGQDRRQSNAYF
jgi:hypothetical protein